MTMTTTQADNYNAALSAAYNAAQAALDDGQPESGAFSAARVAASEALSDVADEMAHRAVRAAVILDDAKAAAARGG